MYPLSSYLIFAALAVLAVIAVLVIWRQAGGHVWMKSDVGAAQLPASTPEPPRAARICEAIFLTISGIIALVGIQTGGLTFGGVAAPSGMPPWGLTLRVAILMASISGVVLSALATYFYNIYLGAALFSLVIVSHSFVSAWFPAQYTAVIGLTDEAELGELVAMEHCRPGRPVTSIEPGGWMIFRIRTDNAFPESIVTRCLSTSDGLEVDFSSDGKSWTEAKSGWKDDMTMESAVARGVAQAAESAGLLYVRLRLPDSSPGSVTIYRGGPTLWVTGKRPEGFVRRHLWRR